MIAAALAPIITGAWVSWTRYRDKKREERGELPPLPPQPAPLRETPDTDIVSFILSKFRRRH